MKVRLLPIIAIFFASPIFAQDTIFIDKNYRWCPKNKAVEFAIAHWEIGKKVVNFYTMEGIPTWTAEYALYEEDRRIRNGKAVLLFPNGKIHKINHWKMNQQDGEQIIYYENGNLKEKEIYHNGTFISGEYYDKEGEKIPFSEIFKLPEYPDGNKALSQFVKKNIRYPRKSLFKYSEGKVVLTIFIDKEGHITNFRIKDHAEKEMDEEAVRLARKLMKQSAKNPWIPATKYGEPRKSSLNIPIVFYFNEN